MNHESEQVGTFEDSVMERNANAFNRKAQSWQAAMSANVGHKYLEKPAMVKELPDSLAGKTVLCVGVGSGEELHEIIKLNPTKVVGIDISIELLKIAQARFPKVEFQKMDMTRTEFRDSTFDFVYSSLTFHYAKDWDALLSEIYRLMRKRGQLLFSTHHPEYWSRKSPTGNFYKNQRGVTVTEFTALLPGNVEITYYNHENADAILEAVEHAGFRIEKCVAPLVIDFPVDSLPSEEAESFRNLKAKNEQTPLFFIVKAIWRDRVPAVPQEIRAAVE
jgi:ubiquinone/menaquinone biosynthesis C-methylase UbiE